MYYDLVNPSDAVTFEAPDLKVAAMVTLILGQGKYAANPEDANAESVPMFFLGGAEEWWGERFQEPLENAGERDHTRLAAALRSVCYGSITDRKLYDSAMQAITDPEKRAGFIAEWNDRHRSSMTNIMGYAHSLAERLEKQPQAA